jgi:hypothetical protein
METTSKMRKAVMLKTKRYKFGLSLIKGEEVLIKKISGSAPDNFTAFRPNNLTLGMSVRSKDIQFIEEETEKENVGTQKSPFGIGS